MHLRMWKESGISFREENNMFVKYHVPSGSKVLESYIKHLQ